MSFSKTFDLEALYFLYPKRLGHQQKAKGLKSLKRLIKTDQHYQEMKRSIENYANHIRAKNKEGTEYVKQFYFFISGGIWEEWIKPMVEQQKDLWDQFDWGP